MRKINIENTEHPRDSNADQVSMDNISKDLFGLLGYHLDSEELSKLIVGWNKSATSYNNYDAIRGEIEDDKNRSEKLISDLITGINALKKINSSRLTNIGDVHQTSSEMEMAIYLLENRISEMEILKDWASLRQKQLQSKDQLIISAIIRIFRFGVSIGLEIISKTGSGRGNKNTLLEFVRIITGIDDKDKLRYYRESYRTLTANCSQFDHDEMLLSKYGEIFDSLANYYNNKIPLFEKHLN